MDRETASALKEIRKELKGIRDALECIAMLGAYRSNINIRKKYTSDDEEKHHKKDNNIEKSGRNNIADYYQNMFDSS